VQVSGPSGCKSATLQERARLLPDFVRDLGQRIQTTGHASNFDGSPVTACWRDPEEPGGLIQVTGNDRRARAVSTALSGVPARNAGVLRGAVKNQPGGKQHDRGLRVEATATVQAERRGWRCAAEGAEPLKGYDRVAHARK